MVLILVATIIGIGVTAAGIIIYQCLTNKKSTAIEIIDNQNRSTRV